MSHVAGIMLNPSRIKSEMEKSGMDIIEGVVLFYPLDEEGIPDLGQEPQKVRDIDAAVRQTEHVLNGVSEQKKRFDDLRDVLTKLKSLLASSPEKDRALSHFDAKAAPLIPSMRVRNPLLVALRGKLEKIYGFIGSGMYDDAANRIVDSVQYIDKLQELWDGHLKIWKERRQLTMSVRNMLHKDSQALVMASTNWLAQEILKVAKDLAADE